MRTCPPSGSPASVRVPVRVEADVSGLSVDRVRVLGETDSQNNPDTPPSSKDGVSGFPTGDFDELGQLLEDYTEQGTTRGFPAWARGMGWRVVRRDGYWFAYNGDRLVAAAATTVRGAVSRQLSRIACPSCGAMPTGEYPTGKSVDDRRSYSCGPHELVR
jgi:hypothetical protein